MDVRPLDIAQDGNLFPREDLLEAVADSDWRDRPVPIAAWALTSIGLAALAAGTPIARFVLWWPTELAASGVAPLTNPIHALAAAIGRTGIGIEATFFLLSALAFGACLPAIGLAMRAAGFGGRLAFVSALVAVASPLLLLHGRLPSDAPFAVLGGAIVLAAIVAPADSGPTGDRGYALRLAAALAAARLLNPAGSALFIPVAFAAAARSRRAILPALVVFIAFAIPHHSGIIGTVLDWELLFGEGLDVLLTGGIAWLAAPLGWIREAEEAPPPRWLAWWIGVCIVLPLIGLDATMVVIPALALLVGNLLARRARPDGALRWAAGLVALQLAIATLAVRALPENTDCFAATGPGETISTDVVLFADGSTIPVYLIQRRLGLQVVAYEPEFQPFRALGRYVFLDEPLAPWARWVLDSRTGEVTPVE